METLLTGLLPLMVASAVVPLWIILTLLLLRGDGGVAKASAFVAGAFVVRIVQGIVFGLILGAARDGTGESRTSVITSTLVLVVGVLLLIAAYKKWSKEEDPDAPPPKWMTALNTVTPLKTFGMGMLLLLVGAKSWVFTLSALAVIREAQLGTVGGSLAYLVFAIAAQSLIIAPIIAAIVAPAQSAKLLDTALGWLERNNRVITIAASLIFGVWFVWKGITGLLG